MRQETSYRFLFFASARQKISQHVESGEIVSIVLDDLTILFNGGVDLPLREEFLSGLYDLSFFESHQGVLCITEYRMRSQTWAAVVGHGDKV